MKAALRAQLNKASGIESVRAMLQLLAPEFSKKVAPVLDHYVDSMIDPQKFAIPPELLKQLKDSDLRLLKKQLQDLGMKMPDLVKQDLKKQEPLKLDLGKMPELWELPAALPKDRLKDVLQNMMDKAESSRWGDYLRDLPGWQKVLKDLNAPAGQGRGANHSLSGLSKLATRWRPQVEWGQLNVLKNLRVPDLSRWRRGTLSVPDIAGFSLSVPEVGVPTLRPLSVSAPGPDQFQWIGWVVLFAAAAFLFGTALRSHWPAWGRKVAVRNWPVLPGAVTTRRQLVQAFDHLALLRLGDKAISWNHAEVASQLPGERQTGQRLAALYEAARYTDGPEALSEQERAAAQNDLCALAGLHSA